MAWIRVVEQGQYATSGQTGDEKWAERVFLAESDAPTTPVQAEFADDGTTAIPIRASAHPDDGSRKLRDITPEADPESGREIWFVRLRYTDKQQANNPVDIPATYEWDGDDDKEPYFIDRSDTPKPVVNSAKERFKEFLTRDCGNPSCIVTKNVEYSAYDPAVAVTYRNVVNSDAITVDGVEIAAGQCKVKRLTAGPKQTTSFVNELGALEEVDYRELKAYLEFREDWDDIVEDRGQNELVTAGGVTKHREIVKGTPPVMPEAGWPLNGSGAAKANVTDAPNELTFRPYTRVPLAPLGLE